MSNTGTNRLYFLPAGLDPEYHPPAEVAYIYRKTLAGKRNRLVAAELEAHRLNPSLAPGMTHEGFVFSNHDPGAKHVRLDVIGEGEHYHLEFAVPIPGKRMDYEKVDFAGLYPAGQIRDLTVDEQRAALSRLPLETTDQDGTGRGDPVNLVVVSGEGTDAGLAFLRNNWDLTEVLTFGNAMKLVGSFLFKSRWRTSPVSPLYVFNRRQDVALQKARGTIHERNHLRLWRAPYTCEGREVWVGQISRDIGLRFTSKAPGFFTHKIDPDTDEARDYLAQGMILSGSVREIAWVGGIGEHTRDNPKRNLTGDPWFTDGRRVVLFLSREPVLPGEVRFQEWGSGY